MASKTPQEAAQDWEENATQEAWEDGLNNAKQSVSEGLADFWGGSAQDYTGVQGKWNTEVQKAIDRNSYSEGVSGKADTWRQRAEEGAKRDL